MLLRFLSHLVGLDVPWLADDLIGDFIALAAISVLFFWVHDGYKGYRDAFYKFVLGFVFLYAVLDVMQLTGWTFFTHNYFLEFSVLQIAVEVLFANTRLQKFSLPFLVVSFLGLSWLVS